MRSSSSSAVSFTVLARRPVSSRMFAERLMATRSHKLHQENTTDASDDG